MGSSSDRGDGRPERPGGLLQEVTDRYGARREGDLPWENGDAYLLGQLGRATIVVLASLTAVYLLSPIAVTGSGSLLRVGKSLVGTLIFEWVLAMAAGLLVATGLIVYRSQQWLARSMLLQSDVPWHELSGLVEDGLKKLGASGQKVSLPGKGLLVGVAYQVRGDYAPVRVVGSPLGWVTWGGAHSLFVVPLPLFRHPRWGQDLDHLIRDVLGWDRPEKVMTPTDTYSDVTP